VKASFVISISFIDNDEVGRFVLKLDFVQYEIHNFYFKQQNPKHQKM